MCIHIFGTLGPFHLHLQNRSTFQPTLLLGGLLVWTLSTGSLALWLLVGFGYCRTAADWRQVGERGQSMRLLPYKVEVGKRSQKVPTKDHSFCQVVSSTELSLTEDSITTLYSGTFRSKSCSELLLLLAPGLQRSCFILCAFPTLY